MAHRGLSLGFRSFSQNNRVNPIFIVSLAKRIQIKAMMIMLIAWMRSMYMMY